MTGRKDAVPAETGGLIVAGRDAYTAGGDLTVTMPPQLPLSPVTVLDLGTGVRARLARS